MANTSHLVPLINANNKPSFCSQTRKTRGSFQQLLVLSCRVFGKVERSGTGNRFRLPALPTSKLVAFAEINFWIISN